MMKMVFNDEFDIDKYYLDMFRKQREKQAYIIKTYGIDPKVAAHIVADHKIDIYSEDQVLAAIPEVINFLAGAKKFDSLDEAKKYAKKVLKRTWLNDRFDKFLKEDETK